MNDHSVPSKIFTRMYLGIKGKTAKFMTRDLGKEIQEKAQTSNDRKENLKHQRYPTNV
jgi:hypothetical protein